jgi:hypothetical protein
MRLGMCAMCAMCATHLEESSFRCEHHLWLDANRNGNALAWGRSERVDIHHSVSVLFLLLFRLVLRVVGVALLLALFLVELLEALLVEEGYVLVETVGGHERVDPERRVVFRLGLGRGRCGSYLWPQPRRGSSAL